MEPTTGPKKSQEIQTHGRTTAPSPSCSRYLRNTKSKRLRRRPDANEISLKQLVNADGTCEGGSDLS